MDKVLHVLEKHVTPEQAQKLKSAGIDSIPALRDADDKTLKDAGISTAKVTTLRAKLKPKAGAK